ncbi:MAG: sulfur transfer protein [Geobacteraceae bacterium]|nr:MAG: sulfur transfer protein [Geobacteraceae bacterium]
MKLEVALFAGLKCGNPELPCHGEREFSLEVPDGTTVRELRALLAIAPAIPLLTIVNNHHEQEEWVLKENDRVGIFPPIGGG